MKLSFNRSLPPSPIVFKEGWKPTRGDVRLRWLPDDEFDAQLKIRGFPLDKNAFAVWYKKQWWKKSEIWIRASKLDPLMTHEAQHVERRINFHEDSRKDVVS